MRRLARDDLALHAARIAARERHEEDFQWHDVLARYQALLLGQKPALQIAAE